MSSSKSPKSVKFRIDNQADDDKSKGYALEFDERVKPALDKWWKDNEQELQYQQRGTDMQGLKIAVYARIRDNYIHERMAPDRKNHKHRKLDDPYEELFEKSLKTSLKKQQHKRRKEEKDDLVWDMKLFFLTANTECENYKKILENFLEVNDTNQAIAWDKIPLHYKDGVNENEQPATLTFAMQKYNLIKKLIDITDQDELAHTRYINFNIILEEIKELENKNQDLSIPRFVDENMRIATLESKQKKLVDELKDSHDHQFATSSLVHEFLSIIGLNEKYVGLIEEDSQRLKKKPLVDEDRIQLNNELLATCKKIIKDTLEDSSYQNNYDGAKRKIASEMLDAIKQTIDEHEHYGYFETFFHALSFKATESGKALTKICQLLEYMIQEIDKKSELKL